MKSFLIRERSQTN